MARRKYLNSLSASGTPKGELSDGELIKIIRTKDPERYEELIKRYRGKIFAYLYCLVGQKEEVEDLLQNVFIKVYKNLDNFDVDRKFSSWIYRIAHNESVNFIKRKYLKKFVSWEDVVSSKDKMEMSSMEKDIGEEWMRGEVIKEVHDVIGRLPMKYKQVLTLRYFSEKSYKEIASILGKPVNTVGTLINRAKNKLLEELKKEKRYSGK